MVTRIEHAMCPSCGKREVFSYVDPYMIQCDNCLTKWHSKLRYDIALAEMAVPEETPDYINSGAMAEDVRKLVDLAEVRILRELELYLPTLAGGMDEVPVRVLEQALRDIRQGKRFQAGLE